jgi:hypothetical protein
LNVTTHIVQEWNGNREEKKFLEEEEEEENKRGMAKEEK